MRQHVPEFHGNSNPEKHHLTVLFIDDDSRILDAIRRSLVARRSPWKLHFAGSVDEGLRVALEVRPDVIVSDVTMPGQDGFALLALLKANPTLADTPVVMLTGLEDEHLKRRALDAGAVDLLSKPIVIEELAARIQNAWKLKRYEDQLRRHAEILERAVADRTADLEASRVEALFRLALAGEYRDNNTGRHVVRVAHFSRCIARALGLDERACDRLFVASPLHDIGKIGLPDSILHKPGKLTPEETSQMQRHCEIGYRVLCGGDDSSILNLGLAESLDFRRADNDLLQACGRIALEHHERWDGQGYPNRLAAERIHLDARIVSVADVLDALASPRPYKPALAMHDVQRMLREGRGTQFDPNVLDAAISVWTELVAIYERLADRQPTRQAA